MIPDWFRDILYIFLGIVVICGAILAALIIIGIIREIIEDRQKGRRS